MSSSATSKGNTCKEDLGDSGVNSAGAVDQGLKGSNAAVLRAFDASSAESHTTYMDSATDVAKDNSTATLRVGGIGNIAALGAFNTSSTVTWQPKSLAVAYNAEVGRGNVLSGGYIINATDIDAPVRIE
ncbi:hypothetical protein OC861_006727 [Tilletia horrida]|nr:hypothetical protein OC861_006727 [Tilletia horrida]